MNKYEGMFLFDPTFGADWQNVQAEMDRLMERCGGRIIVCGKWDERRLAYEIGGHKRAIYVLVYFEAEPDKLVGLERDVQLSEHVLRVLVLRVEHLSEDEMKEALAKPEPRPAAVSDAPATKPAEAAAENSEPAAAEKAEPAAEASAEPATKPATDEVSDSTPEA